MTNSRFQIFQRRIWRRRKDTGGKAPIKIKQRRVILLVKISSESLVFTTSNFSNRKKKNEWTFLISLQTETFRNILFKLSKFYHMCILEFISIFYGDGQSIKLTYLINNTFSLGIFSYYTKNFLS